MKDNIFKSRNHQDHDTTSFHDDAFAMIDTSSTKRPENSEAVHDNLEEMLNTIGEINRLTDASSCSCGENLPSPEKTGNKRK